MVVVGNLEKRQIGSIMKLVTLIGNTKISRAMRTVPPYIEALDMD